METQYCTRCLYRKGAQCTCGAQLWERPAAPKRLVLIGELEPGRPLRSRRFDIGKVMFDTYAIGKALDSLGADATRCMVITAYMHEGRDAPKAARADLRATLPTVEQVLLVGPGWWSFLQPALQRVVGMDPCAWSVEFKDAPGRYVGVHNANTFTQYWKCGPMELVTGSINWFNHWLARR